MSKGMPTKAMSNESPGWTSVANFGSSAVKGDRQAANGRWANVDSPLKMLSGAGVSNTRSTSSSPNSAGPRSGYGLSPLNGGRKEQMVSRTSKEVHARNNPLIRWGSVHAVRLTHMLCVRMIVMIAVQRMLVMIMCTDDSRACRRQTEAQQESTSIERPHS